MAGPTPTSPGVSSGSPSPAPPDRPGGGSVAVVLIAHGSRSDEANDAHRHLAASLADRLGLVAVAAFLELAEPSIPDGIAAAVRTGSETVVVVPYLLHPGRHHGDDIPRLVDQGRAAHPEADIRLLDLFGSDPALVDLLAAQVTRALADRSP